MYIRMYNSSSRILALQYMLPDISKILRDRSHADLESMILT